MSETPVQRLERLIDALDVLVSQEATLLGSAAWDAAAEVQTRLSEIVDAMTPLALELNRNGLLPPPLRARAESIIARQRAVVEALERSRAQLQAEMQAVSNAQTRLHALRPYAGPSMREAASAFAAKG
jgi:hypothetical protein